MKTGSEHFIGVEVIIPVEHVEKYKAGGKYEDQNNISKSVELFILHHAVAVPILAFLPNSSSGFDDAKPHLDVLDDVLAEDEGVGHDGAEHEHDAGQHPQRQSRDTLQQSSYTSLSLRLSYNNILTALLVKF